MVSNIGFETLEFKLILILFKQLYRLGLILGTKIFVNFTKYSFEECMIRLKKEIKNLAPESIELEKTSEFKPVLESKAPILVKQILNPVKNWTNKVRIKLNVFKIRINFKYSLST